VTVDAEPELIDLMHLGRAHVIGAWRVGDVIVDPGPSSCLATLLEQLERDPPRVLALTHIHLDHAGATGSLLRRFPELEVWVHERGAPHLVDPGKLLSSATRLYGADMERRWGEVLPVPAERLRVLSGGERVGGFRVAHTPGHASHHVSYLHEPSGYAFCSAERRQEVDPRGRDGFPREDRPRAATIFHDPVAGEPCRHGPAGDPRRARAHIRWRSGRVM
jgi:glyoxylase-like metal-dependent hydrolase (beta-lactamase superfamily II)